MSIKCMNRVWDYSQHKGSALLLLLAIADYAHDDGTNAFPSISTLSEKVRMTERNVQLLLRKLEESGEIQTEQNAGPKGCNVYTVKAGGEKFSPQGVKASSGGGEIQREKGVKASSPDPSVDPSDNHQRESAHESRGSPKLPTLSPMDPRNLTNGCVKPGTGTNVREVYHEVYPVKFNYMTKVQQQMITDVVDDLDRWRDAVKAWAFQGYRLDNWNGLVDFYRQGRKPETANSNGSTPQVIDVPEEALL